MKPELVHLFRHIINLKTINPTVGDAKTFLGELSNDALIGVLKDVVPAGVEPNELREVLEGQINRLLFKHGPHWMLHCYVPPEVKEIEVPKKKTAFFRIIGDVHGKYDKYAHVATQAEYSLQVGDMGFDYRYRGRRKAPPR
jgi:hypothetical protein